jgi:hypothetical protein
MSAKKAHPVEKKEKVIVAKDPTQQPGKLKLIGGSGSDDWNNVLANQTIQTLWVKHSDDETLNRQLAAITAALVGIRPRDELEGMIASQLIAAHNAAMECYRRAMLSEQTLDGRRENLNQANKLSRTYTSLLEALNRHRGKGQQKVTVEHVHVHEGGQAIVGHVEQKGEGAGKKNEDQSHAKQKKNEDQSRGKQVAHARQPPMWGSDAERKQVQVSGDAERSLPHARRKIAGGSEG